MKGSRRDLESALLKLRTYGPSRNRETDFESRKIILTDDEAMAILEALGETEVVELTEPTT